VVKEDKAEEMDDVNGDLEMEEQTIQPSAPKLTQKSEQPTHSQVSIQKSNKSLKITQK
jgi:hypothetical protein